MKSLLIIISEKSILSYAKANKKVHRHLHAHKISPCSHTRHKMIHNEVTTLFFNADIFQTLPRYSLCLYASHFLGPIFVYLSGDKKISLEMRGRQAVGRESTQKEL